MPKNDNKKPCAEFILRFDEKLDPSERGQIPPQVVSQEGEHPMVLELGGHFRGQLEGHGQGLLGAVGALFRINIYTLVAFLSLPKSSNIPHEPSLSYRISAFKASLNVFDLTKGFRLQFMDEYKQKIEFKPAPVKETQTRPPIELQPMQIDMNQAKLDVNAIEPAETNVPVVIESNDADKAPEQ